MLDAALREIHRRDWLEDVNFLNQELAVDGAVAAGLRQSPPSIITGDPFSLARGKCILVVGINPAWPSKERIERVDCQRAQIAWETGYETYRANRRSYFAEAAGPLGRTKRGDERYSSHFSRLGNWIAKSLGLAPENWNAGPTARRLFRESAAIFDLIPYWSTDTRHLDLNKSDPSAHACLGAWKAVLTAFIEEKKPWAIIVNNCGKRTLIGKMLDCTLTSVPDTGFHIAMRGDKCGTPVLSHPFLNSWRITRAEYQRQFATVLRGLKLSPPSK